MLLSWLELRNFRCHDHAVFRPERGVNVLTGPNGTGKTSILESIGYLSTLRSFRGTADKALVRQGAGEAIVRGGMLTGGTERRVEIAVPVAGRRRVLLDGKRPRQNSELARVFPVVWFLPDDLLLVQGGPGRRRDLLDELAGQLSPQAGAVQGEYAQSLRQRNALLKEGGRRVDAASLRAWDERLATTGGEVLAHRLRLLDVLTPALREAYRKVGKSGEIDAVYRSNWTDRLGERDAAVLAEELQRALATRRAKDMEIRVTSCGPHRDDPSFRLEGRSVRAQASQGEQRTVAFALRVASYRLLEERYGNPPTLLLDDIFSELDDSRAGGVMDILPRGQVLVTTAREDEVPVSGRRWRVRAGSVT